MLLLGIGHFGLYAQETTPASGGNGSSSEGSISFSVGQIFYSEISDANGTVLQGVQQPFEIWQTAGIEQAKGINLNLSAYPNPTTYFLILKIENYATENLSYKLYDSSGKILEGKKITGNETFITMVNRVPAAYFLNVTDENKEIKSFVTTQQLVLNNDFVKNKYISM